MRSTIMWAEVVKASNDKGPYKLVRVKSDDHEFTATVIEPTGFHGSPMKGGKVLVALPDGDMGKATVIGGIAPKDRVDGQKEAELTLMNHKSAVSVKFGDDGKITLTGNVVINGPVEINGDITHNGNMNTSGVHTDSNGPHTA